MPKMRPSGGYRELRTFQTATILYDATYGFCEKFLDPRSRTVDLLGLLDPDSESSGQAVTGDGLLARKSWRLTALKDTMETQIDEGFDHSSGGRGREQW